MLVFKINVLEKLKDSGFSSYDILKKNLIGQSTMNMIRHGQVPGIKAINKICSLLECQPGDIIQWIPDNETK